MALDLVEERRSVRLFEDKEKSKGGKKKNTTLGGCVLLRRAELPHSLRN